jgi:hypothetical protein
MPWPLAAVLKALLYVGFPDIFGRIKKDQKHNLEKLLISIPLAYSMLCVLGKMFLATAKGLAHYLLTLAILSPKH